MDQDVEAKMEKLCEKYVQAAARVELVRPGQLPSGRDQRRLEGRVVNVLGRLGTARKPLEAALVRLAYVRGLRASQPQARLGPAHEAEVAFLEDRLDHALGHLEFQVLAGFRNYMRRLYLARTMESAQASPGVIAAATASLKPYPLEQHARASIRSITDMASVAGALAGAQGDGYDDGENA